MADQVPRRRLGADQSKAMILDAAERLMQREGYAAVNTRSVAIEAGVKAPLVHYHFDTTENLLIASYRRSADRSEALLIEALSGEQPLRAIWRWSSDTKRTALASEFMALASHLSAIRSEMAQKVESFRQLQIEAIERSTTSIEHAGGLSPEVIVMLISAVGRAFVSEGLIGINTGHDKTRDVIERFLDVAESPDHETGLTPPAA